MKTPTFAIPLFVLFLPACFSPSDDSGDEIGDTGSDSDSTTESTESTDESETTAPETETTTSETETASCDTVGCACTDMSDCAEGLECIESVCTEVFCGDGLAQGQEQCDDANTDEGDGCDNDCTFTEVLAVHGGGAHSCALIEGGRVKCWGWNVFGQLGLGNTQDVGDDESPAEVDDVPLPGPAISIALGDQHSCALLNDMGVRCWGNGADGRLGYGNTQTIGDDELPMMAVPVGGSVSQIDAGSFHNCVRLDNGTLRCWGSGVFGRLGYGNLNNVGDNEPAMAGGNVMIGGAITSVAVGGAHSCALLTVGDLRCWGRNEQGQLGYGNLTNVGDNETPATAGNVGVVPGELPPDTAIIDLALGVTHTCALFETGDVVCWGSNGLGELGQANMDFIGDDELPGSLSPIALPGPAVAITAGGGHTCAGLENGDVVCWGSNSQGELGYGNTENIGDDEAANTGGVVELGAPARQFDAGFFHTCAVTTLNEVRCWGSNDVGQLGQGNALVVGDDEVPSEVPAISLF